MRKPTVVEVNDDGEVKLDDLPVTLPKQKPWAAFLEGYDKSTQFNWMQDFLDKEYEGDDLLVDVSDVPEKGMIRVGGSPDNVVFQLVTKKDDSILFSEVPDNRAKRVLKNENVPTTLGSGSSSGSSASSGSSSSSSSGGSSTRSQTTSKSRSSSRSSGSSNSKSRKDYSLSKKSQIVGPSDWKREDMMDELDGDKVFGYLLITTTGSESTVYVPQDDLIEKMKELDLPTWMAPNPVKPYRAFPRACRALLDDREEREVNGYTVEYEVEKNGSRYDKMLVAKKTIPDSETAADGNDLEHTNVARIKFDTEKRTLTTSLHDEAKGTAYADEWEDTFRPRLQTLFSKHQQGYNGKDVNDIMSYLVNHWSDSVKVRDAVYFMPALYDDLQEKLFAFQDLYEWLNRNYKDGGQKAKFQFFGVSDAGQHKKVAKEAVESEIKDRVGALFENIIEEMTDDALAEEIAEDLLVEKADEIDNLAERYAKVTNATIDVKKMMRDRLRDMEDQQSEIVEDVLDEADF